MLSGWHLSYFLSPDKILKKLKSYSHHNDEKDRYVIGKGVPHVLDMIKKGGDLFGGKKQIPFKDKYPRYADRTYFEINTDN